MNEDIKSKIRIIPNWPKKGILFYDITTLLKDKKGLKLTVSKFVDRYEEVKIDYVAGIETRGFMIGPALAISLDAGFIPIRKFGKLPDKTIDEEYEKEYGPDKVEIHEDAITKGDEVLLVDDLIATGGTALAACKLIERLGGEIVECTFLIDLPDFGGMNKLKKAGYSAYSFISAKD